MNRCPTLALAFALCLITCAVNLPAPLYPAYAQLSGAGAGATAVAFAAYVVGVVPVLLLLGGLADRTGRKPLIAIGLVLTIASTSLLLIAPGLYSLAMARCLLGVGTALASATGIAYMTELMAGQGGDPARAASWVTASTSVGFGGGAAATSLFLMQGDSLAPGSFWLQIGLATLALAALARLPDPAPHRRSAMLRLPFYPRASLRYGLAILLAWATSGVVIAILPSVLNSRGLAHWAGFSTFSVISCGLLFQPLAKRMPRARAVAVGLAILPPSYGLIAWGAIQGHLPAVLLGTLAASSACYGFIYLGGLAAVTAQAGNEKTRASAGFFLLAYAGFSLPVVFTGMLADRLSPAVALWVFGAALTLGVLALLPAMFKAPVVGARGPVSADA
ncbi:MFS transporter [Pseudomonas sp. RIT-PI-S]|uniref:MFS transporter n=1 Tax=Pseudomonas sp. RIT-PI-S TaxID=3035295 RepID=UPI0021D895CC|nr:MFS transporter [Pseudomonas sp. RIT-PI-S]